MKKTTGLSIMKSTLPMAMLLSGLLLYGCSGGKTSASDGGNSTPAGSQSGPGFTLNLVDAGAARAARATAFDSLQQPDANHVRVVIRQYQEVMVDQIVCTEFDDATGEPIADSCVTIQVPTKVEVYKDIQDVTPYPGSGPVSVGIPEGDGFTIDVITSVDEAGNHSTLKYGQAANVSVSASNASASVTMNTVNALLDMTVVDSVASKAKFNVTLNNVLPFTKSYKMTMSFGSNTPTALTSASNTCTFTAPESYSAGTISLQGEFTLDRSFLASNETQAQWTRLYPRADYGEAVTSALIPLILVSVPL